MTKAQVIEASKPYQNTIYQALYAGAQISFGGDRDGDWWIGIDYDGNNGLLLTDYDDPSDASLLDQIRFLQDCGLAVQVGFLSGDIVLASSTMGCQTEDQQLFIDEILHRQHLAIRDAREVYEETVKPFKYTLEQKELTIKKQVEAAIERALKAN